MHKIFLACFIAFGITAQAQTITYKGAQKEFSFIKKNPSVAVYDLSALEAVDALGMKLVGAAKGAAPAHLQGILDNPKVANIGGMMKVDFEAVAKAAPELIIVSGRLHNKVDSLSEIAPVLDLSTFKGDNLSSVFNTVEVLSKLAGKEAKGQSLIAETKQKITALQQKAANINQADAAMFMVMKANLLGFPKGSRFGFIHDVLGFKESKLLMDPAARSNPATEADLLAAQPAYIFLFDRTDLTAAATADHQAIDAKFFQQTTARKNKQIVYLTPALWYLVGGGVYSTVKMAEEVLSVIPAN